MRRLAFLSMLAVLAGCPEDDALPPMRAPVAELSEAEGVVMLERGGPAAKATLGALFENDVVETKAGARALLRGIQGQELELDENTRFKLGKSLGSLDVEQGSISFVVDDGDGGATEVNTPFGRTRLAPGTRATLSVGEAGLGIDVTLGEIEQFTLDGGARTAAAGQRLDVTMGAFEVSEAPAPPKPVEPPKPAKVDAQFAAESGKPALKKKGEAKFSPAKKEPQPIPDGTAFQVPAGARARLSTERFTLRLGGGSSGSVESVEQNGAEVKASVPLTAGQATVQFNGPATIDLGKGTLSSTGEATVSVVPTKKGLQLEVLAGEVRVVTPDGVKTVKQGERAEVAGADVEVSARPRPALVLPLGKRVRVYTRRPMELGLDLSEQPAKLVVASDAQFSDPMLTGEGKDFVVVTAPALGELHWKSGEQEGHARFLGDKSGLADEASRSDTVAETGKKATVYFQSVVPALTFSFGAQPGAKAYKLKVYKADELKTPLVEKKSAETSCTVASGQLPEGSYVWFASPLDDGGNEIAGGRMNKMDIIYDNSLTTLSIASPRDGDRAGPEVKVAGVAPLGTKLFVNGKPMPLQSTGRYSGTVGRSELLVFRLVGGDGSESFWLRRLKR